MAPKMTKHAGRCSRASRLSLAPRAAIAPLLSRGRARARRRTQRGSLLLAGLASGAAFAYVLDPERGHRRRRLARDRAARVVRHSTRRLAREGRAEALHAAGWTRGILHRLRPARPSEPLDDAGLAHKVESVLFRDPHVPKGQININAERGAVFLRGQVESAALIDDLTESVKRIHGVGEVVNLLHLPGTEAPHPDTGCRAAPTD